MNKIVIALVLLRATVSGQIVEPGGGGGDATSIKGVAVQDTAGNLQDDYMMRYNLANNQWEYEVVPGAAAGTGDTLIINVGGTEYSIVSNKIKIKVGDGISFSRDDSTTYDVIHIIADLGTDIDSTELALGIVEWLQDNLGDMLSGNTETGITVTYQDGDGTIDFEVDVAVTDSMTLANIFAHMSRAYFDTTGTGSSDSLQVALADSAAKALADAAGNVITSTYTALSDFGKVTDDTAHYQTAYTHSQTTTGNPHSLDTDDVPEGSSNLYNQTHTGDVTGAVALTIAANAVESTMVGPDQINDLDINFGTGTDQVSIIDIPGTAWRAIYTNGSGVITELALGAAGTYLKSNGASSAPTFEKVNIDSIWGIYIQDTTGNLQDNYILKYNLASDQFEWEADVGAGGGEANTISSVGETATNADTLTAGKSGLDLRIKSLIAGTNITLTPTDTTLTIDASGGSGIWTANGDSALFIDADGDTIMIIYDDDAGNVRWQVGTEDQTLGVLLDSLGINSEWFYDLTGAGLTISSNALVISYASGLALDGNSALVVKPGTGLDTTGGTVYANIDSNSTADGGLSMSKDLHAFSSADLYGKIDDETGSGLAVFSIGPTFTNKVSMDSLAVAGSLSVAEITINGDNFNDVDGGDLSISAGALIVDDDSHNHVITNIDAFTQSQLETQLSDATSVFTNNATGDVTISGGTTTIGAGVVDTLMANATEWTEMLADHAGDMASGNTEDGITVTYQDADNTLDYEVAVDSTHAAADAFSLDDINWRYEYIYLEMVHGWGRALEDSSYLDLPVHNGTSSFLLLDYAGNITPTHSDTFFVSGFIPFGCSIDTLIYIMKEAGSGGVNDIDFFGPDRSDGVNMTDSIYYSNATARIPGATWTTYTEDITDIAAQAGDRFALRFIIDFAADNDSTWIGWVRLAVRR